NLVVSRVPTRQRHLVVDVAAGDAGEAAVADLEPLARAAGTLARAADADPAGDVAVEDVEGVEGRDDRGDSVGVARGADAGVRIAVGVAAGEGPGRAGEGDGCHSCGDEEEAEGLGHLEEGAVCPARNGSGREFGCIDGPRFAGRGAGASWSRRQLWWLSRLVRFSSWERLRVALWPSIGQVVQPLPVPR